jgi:hypothetical protein
MVGRHTFEVDGGIGVFLHGRGNGLLYLLLVVVAVDVVAIFVDQGRITVDDRSLVAREFCDLCFVSPAGAWCSILVTVAGRTSL